jgi:hypothetical protein
VPGERILDPLQKIVTAVHRLDALAEADLLAARRSMSDASLAEGYPIPEPALAIFAVE